jgi:hypothetical protein
MWSLATRRPNLKAVSAGISFGARGCPVRDQSKQEARENPPVRAITDG